MTRWPNIEIGASFSWTNSEQVVDTISAAIKSLDEPQCFRDDFVLLLYMYVLLEKIMLNKSHWTCNF